MVFSPSSMPGPLPLDLNLEEISNHATEEIGFFPKK
jgi:hypothetical protein